MEVEIARQVAQRSHSFFQVGFVSWDFFVTSQFFIFTCGEPSGPRTVRVVVVVVVVVVGGGGVVGGSSLSEHWLVFFYTSAS